MMPICISDFQYYLSATDSYYFNLAICLFDILSSCHLDNVNMFLRDILSSCHLVIQSVAPWHLVILSSCHLVTQSVAPWHLDILSSCQLECVGAWHLVILSSCHLGKRHLGPPLVGPSGRHVTMGPQVVTPTAVSKLAISDHHF